MIAQLGLWWYPQWSIVLLFWPMCLPDLQPSLKSKVKPNLNTMKLPLQNV